MVIPYLQNDMMPSFCLPPKSHYLAKAKLPMASCICESRNPKRGVQRSYQCCGTGFGYPFSTAPLLLPTTVGSSSRALFGVSKAAKKPPLNTSWNLFSSREHASSPLPLSSPPLPVAGASKCKKGGPTHCHYCPLGGQRSSRVASVLLQLGASVSSSIRTKGHSAAEAWEQWCQSTIFPF